MLVPCWANGCHARPPVVAPAWVLMHAAAVEMLYQGLSLACGRRARNESSTVGDLVRTRALRLGVEDGRRWVRDERDDVLIGELDPRSLDLHGIVDGIKRLQAKGSVSMTLLTFYRVVAVRERQRRRQREVGRHVRVDRQPRLIRRKSKRVRATVMRRDPPRRDGATGSGPESEKLSFLLSTVRIERRSSSRWVPGSSAGFDPAARRSRATRPSAPRNEG